MVAPKRVRQEGARHPGPRWRRKARQLREPPGLAPSRLSFPSPLIPAVQLASERDEASTWGGEGEKRGERTGGEGGSQKEPAQIAGARGCRSLAHSHERRLTRSARVRNGARGPSDGD